MVRESHFPLSLSLSLDLTTALLARLYMLAAVACALLVFPALIFLSWWDAAAGSVVPLLMLAVILSALENTDPNYSVPATGELTGKTALVVGGGRGIGLAVVQAYLHHGARVVVATRSPTGVDAAWANATEAENGGPLLGSIALDLSSDSSVESFAKRFKTLFPSVAQLDVVVLNSGIFPSSEEAEQGDFASGAVERTAQINFVAQARLLRSLMPSLAPGAVVLASSSSSSRRWAGSEAQLLALADRLHGSADPIAASLGVNQISENMQRYSRSKVLLNAYFRHLAGEHPSYRFFTVFPNPTHTDMVIRGMESLARELRYPALFGPGTRAFDSYNLFWVRALTRSVERVALQYVYGALEKNDLKSGCSYFAEKCLEPQPFEVAIEDKVASLI